MEATGLNWNKLEEAVRERLRVEHYSYRTEQTYIGWIKRFVAFHFATHLLESGQDIRTVQGVLGHADVGS